VFLTHRSVLGKASIKVSSHVRLTISDTTLRGVILRLAQAVHEAYDLLYVGLVVELVNVGMLAQPSSM
jgi:hypothetical protein